MRRFVGLRPKLYSFEFDRVAFFDLDEDGNEVEVEKPTESSVQKIIVDTKNIGKGTNDSVRKSLTIDMYEQCNTDLEPIAKNMKSIRSDHHNVFTFQMNNYLLLMISDGSWMMALPPSHMDIIRQW